MMIRKGMMFGGSVAAIALFAGSAFAGGTGGYPFPNKGAGMYKTTLARSFDVCLDPPGEGTPGPWGPGVVTVQTSDAGMPRMGCVASPETTDTDIVEFDKAAFALNKSHGKFMLSGAGFPLGVDAGTNALCTASLAPFACCTAATTGTCTKAVNVVLTVQVTRKEVATDNLDKQTVTFPLMTGTCPTVFVDAKGKLLQKDFLDKCAPLPPKAVDPIVAAGGGDAAKSTLVNIEVQSVKLVNRADGKTIAVPGVVR